MSKLVYLVPLFPLIGFLSNGLFRKNLSKSLIGIIGCGTVLASFIVSLLIFSDTRKEGFETVIVKLFDFINVDKLHIPFSFQVDQLSILFLLIITGVGFLIHLYSTSYMHDEENEHFARYFSYLNLFVFSMLILVLGANYVIMFIGWEGVGLCSYLLIGYWFKNIEYDNAAKKAFVMNRIGDLGFLVAVFWMINTFGSVNFAEVFAKAPGTSVGILTGITLLLFVGATGKSAQIPLYTWLPDAMAGPTPVSALIHAATMVTAGVYMCSRSWPIYMGAPDARNVIAIIGIATAFFAATIGLAQTDIKKVFAYSTVSQLGYMFVGVGCGAFSAGIFHLMTHAFFKALLFLGSGSVIHALAGEQDLRNMGGLRKKIPWTYATMMCAAVAISGVPPFSGFFSKDSMLVAANHHAPWMYWVGVITAGMTAFYVFRAMFLAFFGEYRGHAHHPHESPPVMMIPLVILAALSLGGGFIAIPTFLEKVFPAMEVPEDTSLMAISVVAGLIGIAVAYVMYVLKPGMADSLASNLGGLYTAVYNKWYVDEIYDAAVVNPVVEGSRTVLWKGVDSGTIDGGVNGVGFTARGVGGVLRLMQSGNIRSYATWVLFGGVLVIVAMAIGLAGGMR